MENRPARPWVRMPSQARMEPPPAQPQPPAAPQPRPPLVRIVQALRPPSLLQPAAQTREPAPPTAVPLPQVVGSTPPSPKSESLPPSPTPKAPPASTSSPVPRAASPQVPTPPPQSPKNMKPFLQSTPESPKTKLPTPPPSPLSLPPSQIKPVIESPMVVVKQNNEGNDKYTPTLVTTKKYLHGNNVVSRLSTSVQNEDGGKILKEGPYHEKVGMGVITIAGENKGAYMTLVDYSNKKMGSVDIAKSSHGSQSDSDEDGNSKGKERPRTVFVNSNVQAVNNSILVKSSITHHDPGVRVYLSTKQQVPGGQLNQQKDHINGQREAK